jgi:hypothetical protein
MRSNFPGFRWRSTANGIQWNGALTPTEDSAKYQIRIVHKAGRAPKVFVDDPDIVPNAPHRYRDGSLCLYWPAEWTWSEKEPLAGTIVPWAALWLYYYELWLFVGEWLGPSSPHGRQNTTKSENSE